MSDETAIGTEMRAGGEVLSVFANPLNTKILRAHEGGARRPGGVGGEGRLAGADDAAGGPCRLARDRRPRQAPVGSTPYGVATELTPMGREMLTVADDVEAWLGHAPGGALELEGDEAKEAVRALTSGWSSTWSGPWPVAPSR